MKVSLMALLFISASFVNPSVTFAGRRTTDRTVISSVEQKPNNLQLSLDVEKHEYKRSERITLEVILNNSSNKDFYVFGTLEWGPSASFTLHLRNARGKEIPVFADDLTPPLSPDDISAFVRLSPQHFLGTYLRTTPGFLGLTRPGRYAIFVEYRSPIWARNVSLTPFWGREDGTIKSNTVWIEVVR